MWVSLNSVHPSLRSDAPHPKITKNGQFLEGLAPNLVKNEISYFLKRRATFLEAITQCVKVSLNSVHPCLSSDAERTNRGQKISNFDQFMTPGDLDLERVNLRPIPGRYVYRYTYTDQVLWNSETVKGVKRVWLTSWTDERMDKMIYTSAAVDENMNGRFQHYLKSFILIISMLYCGYC